MGAYGELEAGATGPETVRLVDRAFRAVVTRRNYPSPSGADRWTADELAEARQSFFADRGPERFAHLVATSTDEDSLRRQMLASVARFLADQTRKTRKGKLYQRLRADLETDPRFQKIEPDRWALREGSITPGEFNLERLVHVAWQLQLAVAPWRGDARREGPPADLPSRLQLLETLLGEAGGSLTAGQLTAVAERRFPLFGKQPELLVDSWDDVIVPRVPAADEGIGASDEAQRIWDTLTQRQRVALPVLHLSARDASQATGIGRTAMNYAQRQTKAVLADVLGPDADSAVIGELLDLANRYARTGPGGSPSGIISGRFPRVPPTDDEARRD